MKRIYAALAILALGFAGCRHGNTQVPPPTTMTVQLTCVAPVGFTAGAGNGFIFSRATCASASSCPANTSGNTSFTALNTATPSATCNYNDLTPPSNTLVVYTVSTLQSGLTGPPSAPSNNGVAISIPAQPGVATGLSGTQTADLVPPILPNAKPAPEMANCVNAKPSCIVPDDAPIVLTAKLEKRR